MLDLSAAVKSSVSSGHSPSGIVAVARHGELLATEAWGDDGYDLTTPFRIASLTKSFTALAVLALRRAGRLGLDDEVAQHLPELKVEAPLAWPALRVRHLLGMSAGIATDNPWGDRQESRTREELSAWLRSGLRLVFPPGGGFEYANLAYAMLGEIVARASGEEYRDYVRAAIIDPLGLGETRFSAAELDRPAPGYHRGPPLPGRPGGWTPQPATGPGAFSPIGGLYSSVRDLVRRSHLYVSREVPPGTGFTAADLSEAQQPLTLIGAAQAVEPLHGPLAHGYGYGLAIESYQQHGKLVGHAGGYPGFTAYMLWHPESGYAVVASANGTHSAAPALARRVLLPLVAKAERAPAKLDPWPETLAAAAALTRLVTEVGDADAGELSARYAGLFAENVELDFPLARRVEHLEDALVSLGALRPQDEPPGTEGPARARWSVAAEHGRLELYLELSPVAPYAVQTFSATAVSGSGRFELF